MPRAPCCMPIARLGAAPKMSLPATAEHSTCSAAFSRKRSRLEQALQLKKICSEPDINTEVCSFRNGVQPQTRPPGDAPTVPKGVYCRNAAVPHLQPSCDSVTWTGTETSNLQNMQMMLWTPRVLSARTNATCTRKMPELDTHAARACRSLKIVLRRVPLKQTKRAQSQPRTQLLHLTPLNRLCTCI